MSKKRQKYGMSTFIGETVSSLPYPIFFDPHYPILLNKPPVTIVTGSPGSGKTFFGLNLAAHANILGKQGIIIDPKGDFIKLKSLQKHGELNSVEILQLFNPNSKEGQERKILEENEGMLDPTSFTDNPDANTLLTMDIIELLFGKLENAQKSAINPIVRDVCHSTDRSFGNVVHALRAHRDDAVSAIAVTLDTQMNTEMAKLLKKHPRKPKKKIDLKHGFIVASLLGIKLPSDTTKKENYTVDERISIAIMILLTSMVLDSMEKLPEEVMKMLIVDEAWVLMSIQEGRKMIDKTARLGRSKNLSTILLTQSPMHFDIGDTGGDLDTMISTRFAFRNNNSKDNFATCRSMRLAENEGYEDIISKFDTGQCLMQDCRGGVALVSILSLDNWVDYFNTNPDVINK